MAGKHGTSPTNNYDSDVFWPSKFQVANAKPEREHEWVEVLTVSAQYSMGIVVLAFN